MWKRFGKGNNIEEGKENKRKIMKTVMTGNEVEKKKSVEKTISKKKEERVKRGGK